MTRDKHEEEWQKDRARWSMLGLETETQYCTCRNHPQEYSEVRNTVKEHHTFLSARAMEMLVKEQDKQPCG